MAQQRGSRRWFALPAPMPVEALRELLSYDPETGLLTWMRGTPRIRVGSIAGFVTEHGYRVIRVNGTLYRAHRLAYYLATGVWPEAEIDHRNKMRDDNRFENLRPATRAQNQANAKVKKTSGSGMKGVFLSGKRWMVKIGLNGKFTYLGTFDTKEEAQSVYASAARQHRGEFASIE